MQPIVSSTPLVSVVACDDLSFSSSRDIYSSPKSTIRVLTINGRAFYSLTTPT